MARECVALTVLALVPGCSLVLNFSDKEVPYDAPYDTPWTSAECAYDQPNGTPQTAHMITPGSNMGPAAICPGNTGSYYEFAVPSGTTAVTVSINFTSSIGDLNLILDDANGEELASSSGFGNSQTITCPAFSPPCSTLAPANYLFEVVPAVPGANNFYTFNLTLTP